MFPAPVTPADRRRYRAIVDTLKASGHRFTGPMTDLEREAVDLLCSCWESEGREDGRRFTEQMHERRSDGSCRCGRYGPRSTG